MPYFSVVIPTYNRSKHLKKAVDSILAQSFNEWELIIIDDGSTDDTKEIIEQYEDQRIRYVFQENAERGAARNSGARKAEGKYVFFLDSDDFISSSYLTHAFEQLSELREPEFFHIRYKELNNNKTHSVESLHKKSILQRIFRQNKFACQFILRKDIALQFPFSENRSLKIGEDWGVILKIASRFPLHFSSKELGVIVQHDERSMQIASAATILISRDLLLDYLEEDDKISSETKGNVFAELTSLAALSAAINKDKKEAKKLLSIALQKRPYLRWTKRTFAIYKKLAIG